MFRAKAMPASRKHAGILTYRLKRTLLEWVSAILLSIGLAILAGELTLRLSSLKVTTILNGVYFSEHPQYFRDQHNAFGYEPFSSNREGAVYSDYKNAWVEYDVVFSVNNAGLVQRRTIDASERYTVLVGDSFMHGLGSRPWFYDLEESLPSLRLANLGVPGTGIQHWSKAVAWFEHLHAPVKKVGVILIADDFFRPYWIARRSERGVAFCYEDQCGNVFIKHQAVDPQTLIEQWYEEPRWGSANTDWVREKIRAIVVKMRLGEWAINLKRSLMASKARDYFELNKNSFIELAETHTLAFVLHLPEKQEALSNKWSSESIEARAFLKANGVNYIDGMEMCPLTGDDFYRSDDHPNTIGYKKIQHCVANLLADEELSTQRMTAAR